MNNIMLHSTAHLMPLSVLPLLLLNSVLGLAGDWCTLLVIMLGSTD